MEFNKQYNREEFLNFLRRNFLPDDFLPTEEQVDFTTKTTYSKQATKLGVCKSLDLVVYEIKHCGKDDPRVGLSKESFRLLAEEWQNRALVLFVPEDNASNYRFSLIEIKLEGNQNSPKVERKYSNPRRYSYYLGEGVGGHTPNEYLIKKGKIRERKEGLKNLSPWDDLLSRFSVEVLTKAFYSELSEWYAWAIGEVIFPGEQSIIDNEKKIEHRSKNVIRLLTRLLFVWFLKQKNLIPTQLFDEEFLSKNILKDFDPNKRSGIFGDKSQESRYYKAILQNLFFATLNCPIIPQSAEDKRERGFRKNDWHGQGFGSDYLMRYENFISNPSAFLALVNDKVPFLNGGLFDCLDDKQNKIYIDGFSDNLPKPNVLIVPDYLFFGETAGKGKDLSGYFNDKKKKNVDVLGLLDILKKYNFTIEENTPFDQDVSLDPELLGKVFENLLASYNPETKTTARKQTGSFYTPREIVQYMVDESIVAHLKRTVGDNLESEYRKLVRYTDEPTALSDEQKRSIIQSLQSCKVLDPACGSGAFPVGILQQMVHILSQIDPDNKIWKDLILDNAIRELGTTLKDCTPEEREEIQDDINRNFDDSVNRPDYARKLYLIENCIYGVDIQPIAIQISKLRFFISLVVDQKPTADARANFGIRPLPNLEAKFVAANTLVGLNKGNRNLFDNREIEKLQEKLIQASHRIFGAKSNKTKNKHRAKVVELQKEISDKLLENGNVGNDDARLMREWRMFDQNASSPFFDPEWMFGVSDGFDIVIGNPPYLRIQGIRNGEPLFADMLVKNYKSATGSFDLYAIFAERGLQLINESGIVNYIMPVKWTNAAFGNGLRSIVSNTNSAYKIISFGAYQVFNASTYTGLHWFKPNSSELQYFELERDLDSNQKLGEYLNNLESSNASRINAKKLNKEAWILTVGDTSKLLNHLEEQPRRMKDIFDKIFQGLATSKDDVYFLYNCIDRGNEIVGFSKYLNKEIIIERGLVKPLLKGEDVYRYDNIKSDRFVIFPYKLEDGKANLYSEQELSELFPIGYNYLKECESVLRGREKGRLINNAFWYRYIYPKNLVLFDNEKLVAPEISLGGNFAYDQRGEFYATTKIYGYIKKSIIKESYKFWLGLFNSNLFWFYLQNTGYVLRGGYFTFKTNYINPVPVPSSKEISLFEPQIISLVEQILEAKKDNVNANTKVLENKIDLLIYKLYSLSYKEVLIIDSETPITKEQYEN